jgi:hypothetical protein
MRRSLFFWPGGLLNKTGYDRRITGNVGMGLVVHASFDENLISGKADVARGLESANTTQSQDTVIHEGTKISLRRCLV